MMRQILLPFSMFVFLGFQASYLHANNLNISNAKIASQDTSNDTLTIQFDISWENSWRDGENFDAVWVFIKYSTQVDHWISTEQPTGWQHAVLKSSGTNPSGYSQGSGTALDIVVPSDRRGFFLQRSSTGAVGTVNTTSIKVLWNYAENSVSDTEANSAYTHIKVFGIEMVYIPQAGFYTGDGSDGLNGEFEFGGSTASRPASVNSEQEVVFGTGTFSNQWYYNTDLSGDDYTSGTIFTLAESFPKGFQAFYAMKYEITQGQYVEFLNTLQRSAQKSRVASDPVNAIPNYYVMSAESLLTRSDRNTITAPSTGNGSYHPVKFYAQRPYRAMNYMSWMDLAAFADWAALRPMSELEYEKIARGPLYPVDGEYSWGSTVVSFVDINGVGDELGTENLDVGKSPTPAANYSNTAFAGGDTGTGPWRVGIVSGAPPELTLYDRANNGMGYYGNADLTGNVWERAVTVGNSAGRNFAGTHGDGKLIYSSSDTTYINYFGNATNLDWPGMDTTDINRGITGAHGSGFRGGAWTTTSLNSLQVSNRAEAARVDTTRGSSYGGRLVRTAP